MKNTFGTMVVYRDPEKTKKRMQAYQGYIDKINKEKTTGTNVSTKMDVDGEDE
ncbi:MAG: hypothetical protein Q4B26_04150 [Eubacteriales bacterium]|nr:hypothetical protein [Eubacteriales bacterium]